jgi:hypothetical protein
MLQREDDTELGAPRARIDGNLAVVVADDLTADVEPEARSLPDRLRREERIEDV